MEKSGDTGREDEVVVDSAVARTKADFESWWWLGSLLSSPDLRSKFVYLIIADQTAPRATTRRCNAITEYYGQTNCKATTSDTNPTAVNFIMTIRTK
jgi:hypothetical protein